MTRRSIISWLVSSLFGITALGEPLPFRAGFDVQTVTATGSNWRVAGAVSDDTFAAFDGLDVLTNDVMGCESSYGDVDLYVIQSIETQTISWLDCIVAYSGTGAAARVGAPTFGQALLTRGLGTNGIPLTQYYGPTGPSPYLKDGLAAVALQRITAALGGGGGSAEAYSGTVTRVVLNGTTNTPDAEGEVDLGAIASGGGDVYAASQNVFTAQQTISNSAERVALEIGNWIDGESQRIRLKSYPSGYYDLYNSGNLMMSNEIAGVYTLLDDRHIGSTVQAYDGDLDAWAMVNTNVLGTFLTDGDTLTTGLYSPLPTATNQLASKQYVDALVGGGTIYYLRTNDSAVAGYDKLLPTYINVTPTTETIVGATNGQYVKKWITEAGAPGLSTLRDGGYQVQFWARVTASGGGHKLKPELYWVSANGLTNIYEIETAEMTPVLTTTLTKYDLIVALATNVAGSTAYRLALKLKVQNATASRNVEIQYGGTSFAHLELVSSAATLSGYLPLTGGTMSGAINFGATTLTNGTLAGNFGLPSSVVTNNEANSITTAMLQSRSVTGAKLYTTNNATSGYVLKATVVGTSTNLYYASASAGSGAPQSPWTSTVNAASYGVTNLDATVGITFEGGSTRRIGWGGGGLNFNANLMTNTGAFVPSADDTRDIGKSGLEYKDMYLDGVLYVDQIDMADSEKLRLGTGADGQLYSSSDNIYIDNVTQNKDIYLRINDAGSTRTAIQCIGTEGSVSFPRQTHVYAYYAAGNQTIAKTSNVTVDFDTESYDNLGEFNLTTDTFTALVSGTYLISVTVKWLIPDGGKYHALVIQSSTAAPALELTLTDNDSEVPVTFAAATYLAAGQTCYIYVYHTAVGDEYLGQWRSTLCIAKIQ